MFVYANLLGKWIELTDDDTINGVNPQQFIEEVLLAKDGFENLNSTNGFVEVLINNHAYHIHKSCIQYTYER